MRDALFAYEPLIRLGAFAGVFVVMAIWELLTPRRPQAIGRNWRWPNNLGVVAVDVLLVRILLPITAVGLALFAEAHAFGLFNIIALPMWVAIIASVILLDLAIYLQHVLFHAVPALWRLHRVHHADLEFDVSTGLRFHPIEILLSMVIKLIVVAAMEAPALAIMIARAIAGDWVARNVGARLGRLIEGVDAEGWRFVAFVRLVPLFPFNLSNYVLGLTRIPLHHYVLATLVCMAPGAVAYTWLGHAGRRALSGETDA